MKIIVDLIEALLTGLFSVLTEIYRIFFGGKHKHKAGWQKNSSLLRRKHTGFVLNGEKAISRKLSYSNCLINGITSKGKSSVVLIPTILSLANTNCSLIINDPSYEIFEKTAGYLQEQEWKVLQLDFANPKNVFFNLLKRANTLSQIHQLAHQLVHTGDTKGEVFWKNKAIEVIVVIIRILKTQDEIYQTGLNIAYILDLMQAKDEAVDQLFDEYADKALFSKYLSIIGQSENTLSSVLSSAQSAVQIFALDENIQHITSNDNLDLKALRTGEQKTVLFIHTSISKMHYFSTVASIFLQQAFDSIFEKRPSDNERDLFIICEEAPVITINGLDTICSNIRKYRAGCLFITQNALSQFTSKYGRDKAISIISNCKTRMYMGAELNTAQELEQQLGNFDYVDHDDGDKVKRRELMTKHELMEMDDRIAVVTVAGQGNYKIKLKPYYKQKNLVEKTEITFETEEERTVSSTPVLLPLETMYPETNQDEEE